MRFSGIHYFKITIFLDIEKVKQIWAYFFQLGLGELVEYDGYGGHGYKKRLEALQSSKVYYDYNNDKKKQEHCHIALPGGACESLLPSVFPELVKYLLENEIKFNITRVDFAFDGKTFTPREFYEACCSDNVTSLVKRENSESVKWDESPFKKRDDGEIGTHTAYFGSRSSQRMIRVYNKRGDTRFEIEMKDERAHKVCLDVFSNEFPEWEEKIKSHVKQFVDFKNISWWAAFMSTTEKASLKVSSARRVALSKMENWFERQVVVSLSVYEDIFGKVESRERLDTLVSKARKTRDRSRYASVLQLGQIQTF